MAIEDAEGLRLLTQPGVTPESVPDILKRIDSVRRPRATKVLIVSFLESSRLALRLMASSCCRNLGCTPTP